MKTIRSWDEMPRYGIVPLTIEADGLKHRIVCDVTAKGKELIEKTLGIVEILFESNWDFGTNDEPHIGCIMLGPEILSMIGVYALFDDGCHEVWMTKNYGLVGIQQGDSQPIVESLQACYGDELVHRFIQLETASTWRPPFPH